MFGVLIRNFDESIQHAEKYENYFWILLLTGAMDKSQGPIVQSVVSLTSSLRVISLTVLADSIYNILIFIAEKM